jgi:hypothetical protein
MPYGKDWSFAVTVPEGWVGECSAEETHGVTVALWPEGAKWPEAPGLLYVTTTRRNGRPLSEVMSADRAEYLRHAPGSSATPDAPAALARLKLSVPVVRTEVTANGRAELIAYGETPNVVVLIVLTAENPAALDSRREDFVRFVCSFPPVDRVREKPVEAAPGRRSRRDAESLISGIGRQASMIATARVQPAEAPRILHGKQAIVNP